MVLKAGNYEDGLYMEDDLLWLNMIAAGAKTGNLDQILCKVRVGAGMFERRGGLRYLKLYRQARQRMLQRGQISYMEYAKKCSHSGNCCTLSRLCTSVYLRQTFKKEKVSPDRLNDSGYHNNSII